MATDDLVGNLATESLVAHFGGPSCLGLNAGAFTATPAGAEAIPDAYPFDTNESPSAMSTASGTMGIPVTLLMNGTVRLARGFTSIR